MADWFHRDCIEDNCYWMIPTPLCQESKKEALEIDPNKVMSFRELKKVMNTIKGDLEKGSLIITPTQNQKE